MREENAVNDQEATEGDSRLGNNRARPPNARPGCVFRILGALLGALGGGALVLSLPPLVIVGAVQPTALVELMLAFVAVGLILGLVFPAEGVHLFFEGCSRLLALGRRVVGFFANIFGLFT